MHSHDNHNNGHSDHHDDSHGDCGHGENINIRAAVVHVVGDMLQSVGVIIASLIIWKYPGAKVADPICTYIFSILVIFTTIPIFKDCMSVLMEKEPSGINSSQIRTKLQKVNGVILIDDFHVWAIAGGKNFLMAHVKINKDKQPEDVHSEMTRILSHYDICHSTLQILRKKECNHHHH